jgi:hypothetical protein
MMDLPGQRVFSFLDDPEVPERRSVKLRVVGGRVTHANQDVPTGRYGPVRIIEIVNVPASVSSTHVRALYESTVDIGTALERDYRELGDGNQILWS